MNPPDVDYMIEAANEPLTFARKKRRQDAEMDITPMIDVTFLLLIFFLVASRMSDETYVRLPQARNGAGVADKTSAIITVVKGNGSEASIYKGNGANPATKLQAVTHDAQQQELADYIATELTVGSKLKVLIKAEAGVRHRDVARVARAAGDAEAEVLYVAVLEAN